MATFLLSTLPTDDLGLVVRALPIAQELQRLGHRAVLSSPAPVPRRVIAEAGFENVLPAHPVFDLLSHGQGPRALHRYLRSGVWRARGLVPSVVALVRALPLRRAPRTDVLWSMDHACATMGFQDAGFVRAGVRAHLDLLDALRPDVVLDLWNPFVAIAARAASIPVVSVIQADAHPRARGFLWWRTPSAAPPSCAPTVNRVLRELRLRPIDRLESLAVGDRTLVVGTPEVDSIVDDAGVTYVGALLWERAGATLPAEIEALGRARSLVWVYSGNPHYGHSGGTLDSAVVLEAAVAALRDEPVDVVLTTGHHALPPTLGPLPPRFRHFPFVPGLQMAARCDLLVHHGGYGSCQAGLLAGKPAVVLPTFSERESNARRLAAAGAGEVVPVASNGRRKSVDVAAVKAAIRRVLSDPRYAERARAVGASLRALGGAEEAARIAIEVAATRTTAAGRTSG
jgi:UDP:flavonoid glycosyltransferase YjiC (YdhE family)